MQARVGTSERRSAGQPSTSNESTDIFLAQALGRFLKQQCSDLHRFRFDAFVSADLCRECLETLQGPRLLAFSISAGVV